MLCPWPLLTVLVTASLATSAPLARRGGSTDQSQQVSGTSDGSIHPISVDGSQQIVNTFSKPPEIPSAVNNAPDPVGMAWVLGNLAQKHSQSQGAAAGASDTSASPPSSTDASANQRREVPPIGAMIGPLMDGLGMAGMMGGMGGGGGGGGGGGSTDQSQQSSGNADDSYHPISVNSGQKVQNNFRRSPLGFGTLGKTSSAPPPPPSSSPAPPPPPSSAAPPPPSSTPPAPSSSSSAPSSTASTAQGGGNNDDDGGSGSGGAGPSIDAGGHANVSVSDSGNDHSKNAKGVGGMSNVTAGNITTHTTVEQGTEERTCYLPTYEDNYFGGGNQTSGIHGVSHVPLTVDGTHIRITSNNEGVDKNQQQNGQDQGNNGQQHKKNGGQQNGNGGQNGGGGGGGNGNGQNNRRAVFARGGGGGGGDCSNCVCNCYCSPNRRSLDATPSSLFSLHERRGGAKKVTTPANCAVVKSQGGLVYSGDQCHLKGQPAKVSG